MLQNLEDADVNLKNSRLSVFFGSKVWASSTSHEDHTMTIANATNSQGKCHVFHKDDGQEEEADQGKDDVSMAIKYNTNDHQDEDQYQYQYQIQNQYKDDVHQDETDDHQHKDE